MWQIKPMQGVCAHVVRESKIRQSAKQTMERSLRLAHDFACFAGCVDWFYGFKLHLAINDRGEILNVALTPGNVDDRKPVRELLKELQGKFVGDKGYISKDLAADLRAEGIILLTKFKKTSDPAD